MKAAILWGFWNVVYLFRRRWRRESLDQWFTRTLRTRSPWAKFKPRMFYNEPGRQWEFHLKNACGVTQRHMLPVEVDVCRETGEIVGFTVREQDLKVKE